MTLQNKADFKLQFNVECEICNPYAVRCFNKDAIAFYIIHRFSQMRPRDSKSGTQFYKKYNKKSAPLTRHFVYVTF